MKNENRKHPVPPAARRFTLSRRAFLSSATAASTTIWLPPLEAMFNGSGTALADGSSIAKRFIEFWWGVSYTTLNGGGTWAPRDGSGPLPAQLPYYFNTDDKYQAKIKGLAQRGEYGLKPTDATSSLSDPDVRKYVRIIDGISTSHVVAQANQHGWSMMGVIAAIKDSRSYAGEPDPPGPSIDRVIGSFDRFRQGTKPNVLLGVVPVWNYGGVAMGVPVMRPSIEFEGMKDGNIPNTKNYVWPMAQFDPQAAFDEMFGGGLSQGQSIDVRRTRSVLDGVLQAARLPLSRLSGRDRLIVEAHLEGVRQLEKNIMDSQSCGQPAVPRSAKADVGGGRLAWDTNHSNRVAPAVARDMRELAVLMVKCDYTRNLVFMLSGGMTGWDAQHVLDFSSGSGPRKVLSAHRDSHDARAYHRLLTPWITGQLAALIKDIAAIPEGGGSAIDNTLIWATSEHGPQVHSLDNIATIVAGGPKLVGGNYFQDLGKRPISDMHLGLLKALGLPGDGYRNFVKPPSPNPIDLLNS